MIIFDEIQNSPKVINSLKYFCEMAPEYHIAVAGSLLDITLAENVSFPVGKVNFMKIYPMTFSEFLIADGSENLLEYMKTVDSIEPIPDIFYNRLYEKLKTYYITGGMPEAVKVWMETGVLDNVEKVLDGINNAYSLDFYKHKKITEVPKISLIWNSIPSQLAKENKKFLYQAVKEGARAREYENAIDWLVKAGLVHKIFRNKKPGLPVSSYDDLSSFKIYMLDVGLLRRLSKLSPTAFREGNRLFTEFNGALTENYILQSLINQFEGNPRYWTQNNPPYEVDFMIQRDNDIYPIEVKSEDNISCKSLKKFGELFGNDINLRIRFSMNNLKLDGDLLNIPLFMVDQTDRLIGLALKQKSI